VLIAIIVSMMLAATVAGQLEGDYRRVPLFTRSGAGVSAAP
jgi:hypothetical protein